MSSRSSKNTMGSQPPSTSLPRQSTAGIETSLVTASPDSRQHPTSSFTTSPASFLNHHANRLKSKLVPNATNSNSSSTLPNKSQPQLFTSTQWINQRNSLIILSNAAAIELYFLCIEDESDAEKLCTKCSEKFFLANMSLSDTIMQAPLIASCIQVKNNFNLKNC